MGLERDGGGAKAPFSSAAVDESFCCFLSFCSVFVSFLSFGFQNGSLTPLKLHRTPMHSAKSYARYPQVNMSALSRSESVLNVRREGVNQGEKGRYNSKPE